MKEQENFLPEAIVVSKDAATHEVIIELIRLADFGGYQIIFTSKQDEEERDFVVRDIMSSVINRSFELIMGTTPDSVVKDLKDSFNVVAVIGGEESNVNLKV